LTTTVRAALLVGITTVVVMPIHQSEQQPRLLEAVARTQTAASAAILKFFDVDVEKDGLVLSHPGGFAMEIHPRCTDWEVVVLFLVGLASLPLTVRRKVVHGAVGAAILLSANLVRLVTLFMVGVTSVASVELAHHVVGPIFLVSCLFLLWWCAARSARRSTSVFAPG
jgi:exosortase/archaeosortase family protein